MFCKEDICIIMERGFGAKVLEPGIKVDTYNVTSSLTVDLTEYKLD